MFQGNVLIRRSPKEIRKLYRSARPWWKEIVKIQMDVLWTFIRKFLLCLSRVLTRKFLMVIKRSFNDACNKKHELVLGLLIVSTRWWLNYLAPHQVSVLINLPSEMTQMSSWSVKVWLRTYANIISTVNSTLMKNHLQRWILVLINKISEQIRKSWTHVPVLINMNALKQTHAISISWKNHQVTTTYVPIEKNTVATWPKSNLAKVL